MDIRAQVEGLQLDEAALKYLGEVGERTSLRYVTQLLTPASILCQTDTRDTITEAGMGQRRSCLTHSTHSTRLTDCVDVDELFHDAKASAELLQKSDKFICG